MMKSTDFIFYDTGEGAPEGWKETLSALSGGRGSSEDARQLVRSLVSFADRFCLSGNVWQHWLAYILMSHENPFTLACERKEIRSGSTACKLAANDFRLFAELFAQGAPETAAVFEDYIPPFESSCLSDAGCRIMDLSGRLMCADAEEFGQIVIDHYTKYGVGIYGIYKAFRVADGASGIELVPVTDGVDVTFDDLIGYEEQKNTLRNNTEAFVSGGHANNVLLYGDSGTGKSTSVHALMHDYFDRGLRLVEISKPGRKLLPQVLSEIKKRNYRFIIFLDDLSFEENESDYKELKAMLEGALETRSDRVLIYATSNRRHLIRETWSDRNDMEYQEDIHHSDTMEEKLSLASRFGVTIYYSKPNAREYLGIVKALTERRGIEIDEEELENIARKWELRHGGMSGRTASQLITWLENEALLKELE